MGRYIDRTGLGEKVESILQFMIDEKLTPCEQEWVITAIHNIMKAKNEHQHRIAVAEGLEKIKKEVEDKST